MKKIALGMAVLLLAACGTKQDKAAQAEAGKDTLAVADTIQATPTRPIEGMDDSEISSAGVKAWIADGVAYWNIYDKASYLKATNTFDEFYRIGDGPFRLTGMDETPIGVFLAPIDDGGNIALFVIGHKHHVYAFDISLEVSMVGGGVGKLDYLADVERLCMQDGKVVAIDVDGNANQLILYRSVGPFQLCLKVGEQDYYMDLSSTWNIRFTVENGDYYTGRFSTDDDGYYKFTLNRHYTLGDDYTEHEMAFSPISASFRLNNRNETLIFEREVLGLRAGQPISYEILPLFD